MRGFDSRRLHSGCVIRGSALLVCARCSTPRRTSTSRRGVSSPRGSRIRTASCSSRSSRRGVREAPTGRGCSDRRGRSGVRASWHSATSSTEHARRPRLRGFRLLARGRTRRGAASRGPTRNVEAPIGMMRRAPLRPARGPRFGARARTRHEGEPSPPVSARATSRADSVSAELSAAAWALRDPVLIASECDYGCPCNVDGRQATGQCEGGWTRHVDSGRYGAVRLDTLSFSIFADWPGEPRGQPRRCTFRRARRRRRARRGRHARRRAGGRAVGDFHRDVRAGRPAAGSLRG